MGENKNENSKLNCINRKLQTNKVKFAVKIFDYIHTLDSIKLAKNFRRAKNWKDIKIFIQLNIGDEPQKSGINKNELANY